MRDFDDASAHLKAVRGGNPPAMVDANQRISDLKGAGLVIAGGQALTDLGAAVLMAWEKYGVDSTTKTDELARLLLMVLEARSLGDKDFERYLEYWSDLRTHFDVIELIDNWDSLYQINYLDFEREGFSPGSTYRDEQVSVADIEFDLADYARDTGAGAAATKGGDRIAKAMGWQLPRGRHRATACMAYELVLTKGQAAPAILGKFGFPKKPRVWEPFNDVQKGKIAAILADYGVTANAGDDEVVPEIAAAAGDEVPHVPEAAAAAGDVVPSAPKPIPELPTGIDFSAVLVDPPKPKAQAVAGGGKGGGPKKVDHKQKAHANDAVGKLGEDFAVAYERWRLRDHTELLKKLRHVSKEDDTLGYDIESFELDGTPRYIEVKGTLGPMETRFFLSASELACAESKGEQYVVLRVAQLANEPKCCEIRFPFAGQVILTPATYSVAFVPEDGQTE
jgi:Domain of unknown function (DUF3883)